MPRDDVAEFPNSKAIAQTDKALRVIIDGEKRWVPQSVIHADSEVWKNGDEGTLVVQEWFAIKEGWV